MLNNQNKILLNVSRKKKAQEVHDTLQTEVEEQFISKQPYQKKLSYFHS